MREQATKQRPLRAARQAAPRTARCGTRAAAWRASAALLLLACAAGEARAQRANASAAALGMAENYTAAATGHDAVAWNPALLAGARARPWSFTVLGLRASSGLTPITLGDLAPYSDVLVPDDVRDLWRERIAAADGQHGRGAGDINWFAVQYGRYAVQITTSAVLRARVSPGIAELVMLGNVDADGAARQLDLAGSSLRGSAFTTVSTSYASPLRTSLPGAVAVGGTLRWIRGHAMVWGSESVGAAGAEPLEMELFFPVVHTRTSNGETAGDGLALDVGAAYDIGTWTVSATLRNAVNTFGWREFALAYRPFLVRFDQEQRTAQTEAQPFHLAPEAVTRALRRETFRRALALGVAARPQPRLLVAADARAARTGGIDAEPRLHVGAGVEYALRPWLPLRTGAALVGFDDDGTRTTAALQLGVGAGVHAGPLTLSFGYLRRATQPGTEHTLLFGGVSSVR